MRLAPTLFPAESPYSHAELVQRAVSWLRNRQNCRVVLAEQTTGSGEVPDAIGWKYWTTSYLVECKVSRSDFHADRSKPFRKDPAQGMGDFRYFMAPAGVLTVGDLDESCVGWGLLAVHGRSVTVLRKAEQQPRKNALEELAQGVQALAQAQMRVEEPLHEWLTGPDSPVGKFRAAQKAQREEMKTRTCAHARYSGTPYKSERVACTNHVANGYSHCSLHGGRTRGDRRDISAIREEERASALALADSLPFYVSPEPTLDAQPTPILNPSPAESL